jgi:hypothetical protein
MKQAYLFKWLETFQNIRKEDSSGFLSSSTLYFEIEESDWFSAKAEGSRGRSLILVSTSVVNSAITLKTFKLGYNPP